MATLTWAEKMNTAWKDLRGLKGAIKKKYSFIQRMKWMLFTKNAPADFSQFDAYFKHLVFCDLSGYINPSKPAVIFKNAKDYDSLL